MAHATGKWKKCTLFVLLSFGRGLRYFVGLGYYYSILIVRDDDVEYKFTQIFLKLGFKRSLQKFRLETYALSIVAVLHVSLYEYMHMGNRDSTLVHVGYC